jgi:hypothetical protein
VGTFPDLVGGEAITVCGESLFYRFEGVRRIEEGGRVEVLLDGFNLLVDCFGDEEIDAVPEVFDKALSGLVIMVH